MDTCRPASPNRKERERKGKERKGKEGVEAAATQRKLALASVSGVAGPWVSWAILKEGRRRSEAPLVHKPLCKIPHFVSQPPHGTVGDVLLMTSVKEEEIEFDTAGFELDCSEKSTQVQQTLEAARKSHFL